MLVNVGKNGQKVKRKATWNGQDQQEVGLARCWERVRSRIQSCRKQLTGMTRGMEIVLKVRVGRFFFYPCTDAAVLHIPVGRVVTRDVICFLQRLNTPRITGTHLVWKGRQKNLNKNYNFLFHISCYKTRPLLSRNASLWKFLLVLYIVNISLGMKTHLRCCQK